MVFGDRSFKDRLGCNLWGFEICIYSVWFIYIRVKLMGEVGRTCSLTSHGEYIGIYIHRTLCMALNHP